MHPDRLDGEPSGDDPANGESAAPQPAELSVVVRRSARRRRTVGAMLRGDVVEVAIPSWMSAADEARWVEEMRRRFARKLTTERFDLPALARRLARRHDLPAPARIAWSDTMRSRWGSCTPTTGEVRVSSRVARFPDWVVEYVVVHELAHLVHPDHSPAFWQLVARYPMSERAIGYLIAKSGEGDGGDG